MDLIVEAIAKISGSASKVVFIMLALTACIAFVLRILPVDQFMTLATAAFVFYFSAKGETSGNFAGK
jgi:hypothetical protein